MKIHKDMPPISHVIIVLISAAVMSACRSNSTPESGLSPINTSSPLQSPSGPLGNTSGTMPGGAIILSKPLVYEAERAGSTQIYRLNPDGIEQQLTTGGINSEPRLSHDGTRIAYTSNPGPGKYDIYIMNSDGSNKHRLLKQDFGYNWAADWSPDNSTLLFSSNISGKAQLYTVSVDGDAPKQIMSSPGNSFLGTWSPDGKRIAFTSDQIDGITNQIYVMTADGSGVKQLTNTSREDNSAPSWSFDGQRLFFQSHRGTSFDIYTINIDGTDLKQITKTGSVDEMYPRVLSSDVIVVSISSAGINKLAMISVSTGEIVPSSLDNIQSAKHADYDAK
jgi:TolB protein